MRRVAPAPPRVIVSVHDVSPRNLVGAAWLLARLDDIGASPRVLKVIPDEGGTAPIADHPGLIALLREESALGTEVVLHGFTHQIAGRLHGSPTLRLRAALFAPRDAEFLSLARGEAAFRIRAGLEALAGLGFVPRGFCAPAWLGDAALPSVLREAGLRYYLSFSAIHDLERRKRWRIPAVGYMGAGPVQESLVGVERALVGAIASRFPTVRVFVHPQGAERSGACAAVLRSLERMLRSRSPVTYAEVLGG